MEIFTLKNAGLLLAFLIGAVGLPMESFTIFAGLIFLDSFTGVLRAGMLHGWRSVTSAKFTSGLITKMLVIIVPLVVAWAGKGAEIDLLPLAKGTLTAFILAEAYSVLGNIHAIRTGEDKKEWDAIAWILCNVRKSVERLFIHDKEK